MVDQSSMDAALARIGGWKRWHVAMYVLVTVSHNMPISWQGISIVFQGWEPPHVCIGSNSSPQQENNPDSLNSSQPHSNLGKWNVSNPDPRCQFVNFNETTGNVISEKCNEWSYDNGGYFTIVEEWDLVCDRNYMAELSQSLNQFGLIIGACMCFVMDIYGRKKIHIVTHFIIAIVGLINAYPVSYLMFAITRTLLGILIVINATSGGMLLLEFFDSKRRTLPCIFIGSIWTLLYISLAGLSYIIRNWSHLQITISLASLVFAVMVLCIPESAAWLASKGKIEEADKVLRNIAKWNNVKLDFAETLFPEVANEGSAPQAKFDNLWVPNASMVHDLTARQYTDVSNSAEDMEKEKTFVKLLNPIILKLLAISCIFWFSVCLVYYSIIFSTPTMAGNRFLNFIIISAVELPTPPMTYILSKTIGRRLTSSISLLVAGSFLAVASGLQSNSKSMEWLNLVLIIISKIAITVTFPVMLLYTKEYFPTDIRATCHGICQVSGRVGSMLAPFIGYVMMKTNFKMLPKVILALSSLVASLVILFLPETKDQPLPDSMEDCRKLCDQKTLWCHCCETFKKTSKTMKDEFLNFC